MWEGMVQANFVLLSCTCMGVIEMKFPILLFRTVILDPELQAAVFTRGKREFVVVFLVASASF